MKVHKDQYLNQTWKNADEHYFVIEMSDKKAFAVGVSAGVIAMLILFILKFMFL